MHRVLGLIMLGTMVNYTQAHELVPVQSVNGRIRLDIRYATTHNFTHTQVYPKALCYVHKAVAQKLNAVQKELEPEGLGLKIWDGYRPLAAQKLFWQLVPDERYVARPDKGSRHNRGAAVDVTLVDSTGKELAMPTAFDDFTPKAHRHYTNLSPEVIRNRKRLQDVMTKHGFVGLLTEWWHFDDAAWREYPLLDIPFEQL